MIPVITLTALALILAATAATFSVIGLREFAPGAALAVTVLGGTVEVAKLVIAAWLKSAWSTMPRWMRASGCAFVLLIMLLTSLGTFAFLTAAHGSQAAGRDASAQAVQSADASVELHHQALDGARREEAALRAEYDAFIAAGKVSKASGARQADSDQLAEIRRRIEREQTALEQAQADRVAAQQALTGQEAELGPVRSLADLIGGSEIAAVNIFIGLLMAVFDPLAVWLSIAASHAARGCRETRAEPMAPIAAPPEEIADVAQIEPARVLVTHPELMDAGAGERVLAAAPPKRKGGRPAGSKDKAPRKRKADAGHAESTAGSGMAA